MKGHHRHLRFAMLAVVLATLLLVLLLPTAALAANATPGVPDPNASVVRQLPELTTEYSDTYLLSNGLKRVAISAVPIHFKDATGTWRDFDTTLVPSSVAGVVCSASTPVAVSLADLLPGQYWARLDYQGATVQLGLMGAAPVGKMVLGDSARYLAAAPGCDLTYRALREGLEFGVTLASPQAQQSFTFTLSHPGLILKRDATGLWGFYRPGEEEPLLILSAPLVFDSSKDKYGDPAYCETLTTIVAASTDTSTITYTLPADWLSDPARVYPVTLDPRITPHPSADTYISSSYPDSAYGSDTELRVGCPGSGRYLSFVKFNLSSIAGAYIYGATLEMYQFYKQTTDATNTYIGIMNESWSEASTWNTLVPIAYTYLDTEAPPPASYMDVACGDQVQNWASGAANYGFYLYQKSDGSEDNGHFYRKFYSGEAAGQQPTLYVDYDTPSVTVSGYSNVYRVGDTVKVTCKVFSEGWSFTHSIRMNVNRAGGDATRYRGWMGWFDYDPGANYVTRRISSTCYLAYWNGATDYGQSYITPDLAASGCGSGSNYKRATFVFKINDNFGNVQDNDFDTRITMGPNGETYDSGFVNNDTNVDIQAKPITAVDSLTNPSASWFTQTDGNGDGVPDNPNDANGSGRGDVVLSWAQSPVADGYHIYLFGGQTDGNGNQLYQPVGALLSSEAVGGTLTWSSSGAGIFPKDSEVNGWTSAPGNPYYHAATPDDPSQLALLQPSGLADAGVLTGDGTYLWVHGRSGAAPLRWTKISTAGAVLGTVGTEDLSAALSGFYLSGYLYNGYVTKSGSSYQLRRVLISSGVSSNFTLSAAPLDRATGSPLTASSSNVILACDGSYIYSFAASTGVGGGYDGYKIRRYSTSGTYVDDHTISTPSRMLCAGLADAGSYYLIQWTAANTAHIVKVSKTSWKISNDWGIDQGTTAVCTGFCDQANNLVWLGANNLGKIYKYSGAANGLDLRDNPQALYAKAGVAPYSNWAGYQFLVVPYNFHSGESTGNPPLFVTPENRTVNLVANDPQHTTHDLGQWNGHAAEAQLDTTSLNVSVTDLVIASWGPPAALERCYASTSTGATTFAYGWRFSFQRSLTLVDSTHTNYTDEMGMVHSFISKAGIWRTPNGFFATLAHPGSTWTLTLSDMSVLTFDSTGKLTSEADRNGNTVNYTYPSGDVQITAANGQSIYVDLNASSKIVSATYTTADGTRQVNFATASPWQVTYWPGRSEQRVVSYTYDGSNRLTDITQADWPAAGQSVSEHFTWTSGKLTDVRYPDYNATSKPDAHAVITNGTGTATVTRYGRVNDTANQPLQGDVYTWATTGQLPAGTMATHKVDPSGTGNDITYTFEYSDDFEETTVGSSQGDIESASFDANGNQTGSSDLTEENGQQDLSSDETTYDAANNPTSETDAVGSTTTYTYDSHGNVLTEEKLLGYDAQGQPVKSHSEYSYDAQGRKTYEKLLISGTPQSGTWAETDYDSQGYWPNGEPKAIVSKGVLLSYNGTAQDLTVNQTYDAFGNLLSKTDSSGTRTTETDTYDIAGRQLTSADALGATIHHTYDKLGYDVESWVSHFSTAVKANWVKHYQGTLPNPTSYGYDAMGRETSAWTYLHDGSTATPQSLVSKSFDGVGNEITSDDNTVGGMAAKKVYDERGNVLKQWVEGVVDYTDARATVSTYDADNRVTAVTEPGTGASSTTTYYPDGFTLRETQPDGSWVEYAYDAAGNKISETKPLHGYTADHTQIALTKYAYDLAGRLSQQTDPGGQVVSYAYDLLDRQTAAYDITDPENPSPPVLQTIYNGLGWVLRTVDADGVTVTKVYDAAGRETSETKGSQNPTSYTYDDCNRTTRQTDPDGRILDVTFDCFGNKTREKHTVSGVVTKDILTVVDSLGRPTSATDQASGGSGLQHTWTYPIYQEGGISETQRYDSSGTVSTTITRYARGAEMQRQTTYASGQSVTRAINSRDAADRVTQATFATNLINSWSFDGAGRLVRQSGTGYAQTSDSYVYDPDTGQKTTDNIQLAYGGTIAGSYSYGADARLNQATLGGITQSYGYDSSGNLITVAQGSTTTTYTYNAANQLTQASDGTNTTVYGWNSTYGWRTSQTLTGSQAITFTYTATGRLASYGDPNRGLTATYSYDAAGQRTRSVVTQGSTTTTTDYKYDGITLLGFAATQGSSSWRIDYLYDENGSLYGAVYRDPATSTTPTVFGMVTTDRGDVVELLDTSGAAFAAYRYDVWGNPTSTTTQSTSLINSTLASNIATRQLLRYASYCYDAESGLYYCSARSYDPATRQWISKDPQKADGEESAYQYCVGDPVEMSDSTGQAAAYKKFDKTFRAKVKRWRQIGKGGYWYYTYEDNVRIWATVYIKWNSSKITYMSIHEGDINYSRYQRAIDDDQRFDDYEYSPPTPDYEGKNAYWKVGIKWYDYDTKWDLDFSVCYPGPINIASDLLNAFTVGVSRSGSDHAYITWAKLHAWVKKDGTLGFTAKRAQST